jgi:hypothetical protein
MVTLRVEPSIHDRLRNNRSDADRPRTHEYNAPDPRLSD